MVSIYKSLSFYVSRRILSPLQISKILQKNWVLRKGQISVWVPSCLWVTSCS